MGRAKKQGMDYFPVDVNLMESTAIKVLTARFGAEGFYLYMFLMCRIHLGGYYIEVSEDFISCAAVDTRIKEKTVADMIELMCTKGLFDAGLYEKYGILTSLEIQETYLDVKCKRGRGVEVFKEYWLLNKETTPENLTMISVFLSETKDDLSQTNEDLLQTNADMSQKKCINKTKENKTEQNEILPSAIVEQYNSICTALPKVRDLTEPRKKAIKSALKRLGQEGLIELFRRTAASAFLCGKKGGWKASFDWILKPANLTKILEGNFDNAAPTSQATLAPQTTDYTCGGKYVNMLALTEDLAPEDYPF